MSLATIRANWPAPVNVHAHTTMRTGGCSPAPFHSFNLGDHVGDHDDNVASNRSRLQSTLQLPAEPFWLEQVHSTIAVEAKYPPLLSPLMTESRHSTTVQRATGQGRDIRATTPIADASYSAHANTVCAVMTADCVPIVLLSTKTLAIAAIHAGWRGLCDGVIESTVTAMNCPGKDLIAWIGPCISQAAYEVGDEVRKQFIAADAQARDAFLPNHRGRWQADMVKISTQRLQNCHITGIYGGNFCTYREPARFFSFRRDNQTGRMATLIWRE